LFLEYEDVLNRPEQRLATGMSEEDVTEFMAAFASAAEPIDVHFLWRPQLTDPADELVLEAVFLDLGFDPAEAGVLALRAEVMIRME
jgi:hypothetical protein